MAYVKTWSTKEEVLKDLAKASGRRINKKEHLDEGYLVIGDAPPPVLAEDEDDEMHILFGDAASRKALQTEDATPDLLGIQQMLRMMQEFNSGDDDDINDPASDCVIAISKVSKLNPNVQEFIPKSVMCNSPEPSTNHNKNNTSPSKCTINNRNVSDSINKDVVTQKVDVVAEASSKKETEVSTNNIDVDVDVSAIKEEEYQDIATTLKNKICDAAKSDSYEFKRQKNVAIATLLRLYANKSPKKSTEPVKLFTPEYFEGKKGSSDVKLESITKEPLTTSSSTSSTPEPKDSTTTIPSNSSNSTSSTPLETKTSPKIRIDPEIKKSIDKVNKWLEEPTKRKSPAVCLGPIAFKRKDPIVCKSPVSATVPKPVADSRQQYQPSKYAADLAKQYLERSKILENKKKDVTWLNLEDVLKQKDSIIKKQLEEQASASESNDDSVSGLR